MDDVLKENVGSVIPCVRYVHYHQYGTLSGFNVYGVNKITTRVTSNHRKGPRALPRAVGTFKQLWTFK